MKKHVSESGETTFLRITNKDIYNSIQELNVKLDDLIRNNSMEHKVIFGRVMLNKWIATTSLTIALASVGYLIHLILK